MRIESIDKAACKAIDAEARAALEQVAEKLGLTVKLGGGSYDPTTGTYTPRVTFSVDGAEARAWAQVAALVGLAPDDYGREIAYGGIGRVRLVGINLRARRFPILVERVDDGKVYKVPEASVAAFLKVAEQAS